MSTPKEWIGYVPGFLEGFLVPTPLIPNEKEGDVSVNTETGEGIFHYINYSSVHCRSRRMPFFSASNIYRESWLPIERAGTFTPDPRLAKEEQLSSTIYTELNKKTEEKNKKVDKGHLTRREDVQWAESKNKEKAQEAAESTFYYTNACPQHHQLNNELWKYLENAVLVRGRSKKPPKASVFTGPIFNDSDPLLVFPKEVKEQIKCPLRFWKVIYYVSEKDELHCAAFIMSHKLLMERDGHILRPVTSRGMELEKVKSEIPFLYFEENEKYQITLSLLQDLTGLQFPVAKEGLTKDQLYSKLTMKPVSGFRGSEGSQLVPIEIDGLVL